MRAARSPVLRQGFNAIPIPPAPTQKVNFVFTPSRSRTAARSSGSSARPIGTPAYQHATYVRPIGAAFTPAMPLSVGHITMLIAGQETGVLTLPSEDGSILVKGMSRKVIDVSASDMANDKGQYTHTTVNEREKHVATITIAHTDGAAGDAPVQPPKWATSSRSMPIRSPRRSWSATSRCITCMPTTAEWQGTGRSRQGSAASARQRGAGPVRCPAPLCHRCSTGDESRAVTAS